MTTNHDTIQDSRAEILGLSMDDFKDFVLFEEIATSLELAVPGRLSKLASDDEIWETYEEYAQDRYQTWIEDQRTRMVA